MSQQFIVNSDATPVNINNLVAYQSGSVVSREIYSKSSGTITLFAFDETQGLSEHTAPFDALVQVLEGKVRIIIAGREFTLSGGEIIIMPANIPHALKAITQFKMMLIMMRARKE